MNLQKATIVLVMVLLSSISTYAQEAAEKDENKRFDVGLEGMLGVSFGRDFYSVNVGGPALFLVLNEDWKVGAGALPSLYMFEGKLGARLGVAPRVDYKNLVLFAPFFHRDISNEWIWSVGFGYKFHRKKAN